ncbi:hypothetical protein EVJ58_g6361 [Rhodofomes roseus]|uniref:Uncharacterized protein n=1 Tax=Rhodofomes roseus TaxID=34475 RepID=A0A4Y9YAQ9_9APHY|nr:hypothetical protein EVJ58_g6361 [Rhodofomes roseus]
MPAFTRPQDFEVDGQYGRCKVCKITSGKSWAKLAHLHHHETSLAHREAVAALMRTQAQAATAAVQAVKSSHKSRSLHTTVEDVPDIDDFPQYQTHAEWDHAELWNAGIHDTGEEFEDSLAVSLHEVLDGAGLFEAITNQDEAPALMDAFDVGELLDNSGMAGSSSHGDITQYVLFSSPRLRFSRAQQEAILAWGKDLGARDVPSLYGVEKFQREALESLGNPTVKVTATSGNVYYRNTIRDTIAKDYAHPDTRREIHCHPQLVQTKAVSQAWHSKKWLVDAPDFLLTPMVRLKGKDFYVDELVHCADGQWFIPTRFFEMEDRALWAVGYVVERRAHVAELCSHIGLGGNFFCRCCHAGGTKEFRESDEGFKTLMEPGIARTVNETRDAILQHLIMATHAAADKRLKDAISTSGVKDSFAMPIINRLVAIGKALRRSTPTRKAVSPEEVNKHLTEELLKKKDTTTMNPLLRMEGFDVHKDTPVEPLHTVILGIIKYFWGQTVWILEKQGKFAEFRAKLSSLGRSGLRIPNIMADYLCRYRSSLIGKHFKTLSQIMAFAVCGLVDQDLQDTWFALGRLTVLIWETEITNMSAYVKDLRDAIRDVMDFAAKQSPSLITLKNKFHILSHLPDHIERFGPALLFSTERYESFNRIFRLCSIHSNRQAPSRDIAMAFANQDRCRHMITGGYWLDKMSKQWVRAGAAVTEHFKTDRHDAHLLGVDIPEPPEPGRMTFPAQPRGPRIRTDSKQDSDRVLDWTDTEAGRLGLTAPHGDYHWQSAVSVVATEGDVVGVGNEVLVRQEGGQYSPLGFASVVEILFGTPSNTSDHSSRSLRVVVVQMSQLDDAPHQKLRMPTLHRTGDVRLYPAQDIVCAVNIQHDCSKHGCSETGTESIRQEREETTRTRAITKHHDSTDYVVNVLALHNQRLLREALPEPLRVKPVFFTDRAQLHKDAAVSLRDQKLQKKLTKDAAIRKRAEDALRLTNQPASLDLLAEDDETPNDTTRMTAEAGDLNMPEGDASEPPSLDSLIVPRARDSDVNLPSPDIFLDLPRQLSIANRSDNMSSSQQVNSAALYAALGLAPPRTVAPPQVLSSQNNENPSNQSTPFDFSGTTGLTSMPSTPRGASPAPDMAPPGSYTMPGPNDGMGPVQPSGSSAELPVNLGATMGFQPPSVLGRRRSREDDDYAPPTGPARQSIPGQLLRAIATEKSMKAGLTSAQLEEVLTYVGLSVPEMLIDLKIHLIKMGNDILNRYFKIISRHPDFHIRVRAVVAAVLLAANVPAYQSNVLNHIMVSPILHIRAVQRLTARSQTHLERNLHLINLDAAHRNDPADWAAIELSIKNKDNIYQLTKTLMTHDMKVVHAHWGRFAFLRLLTSQIKKRKKKGKKKLNFWKEIDIALLNIRTTFAPITNVEERKLAISEVFAGALKGDVAQYGESASDVAMTSYSQNELSLLQATTANVVESFKVDIQAVNEGADADADENDEDDEE